MTIGPGVAIQQSIGVASNYSGPSSFTFDGIFAYAWMSAYVFVSY